MKKAIFILFDVALFGQSSPYAQIAAAPSAADDSIGSSYQIAPLDNLSWMCSGFPANRSSISFGHIPSPKPKNYYYHNNKQQ